MKFPFVFLLVGVVGAANVRQRAGCNGDNCARAVTGTAKGSTRVVVAQSDCSSFLETTVTKYASTTTVVQTAAITPLPVPSKPIPSYATACSGSVRYSSACSCWGIAAGTKTISSEVTTVFVSSTPTGSGTTEPGPPFKPIIPASYENCALDPNTADEFLLLDAVSVSPMVNNNGVASVATEILSTLPSYRFLKPAGAPPGIFDIVLSSGSEKLYFSVFSSGKVGFTSASSNGQSLIDGPDGEKYVTTIFALECGGKVSAGILGSTEYNFKIVSNNVVVDNFPPSTKIRRDIPVPKGFIVKPTVVKPPKSRIRCPNPGQQAVPKSPPVPPETNGCSYVPDGDFTECCNQHDICYDTCSTTFESCNSAFRTCNINTCNRLYQSGTFAHWKCTLQANTYGDGVDSWGEGAFTDSTQARCDCKCTDPALTNCNGKCVNLKTDADNCGQCFFKCPTGKCTNGACAFNACTNLGRCEAFSACGPGGSCVCAGLTDGTGFCVDGQTPCAGLPGCGTSADCALGSVCAVGSCCQRNVCVTTDTCGGKNSPPTLRMLMEREFVNGTIASKGVWVDKF
ncbi:hypothetical protein GJ744_000693 [Endocarpon pusillum]|uniref:Uncharacterized protein n=1 Tax=Endocarpon pusillum TaxID=364733 RepID=A0A8H7AEA2_9EURO|nr:hypothetical protein GJ744_000693 [Endocarpon pusillum]